MEGFGGLVELGIVALFALGWWVLERQGKRLDRIRAEEKPRATKNENN